MYYIGEFVARMCGNIVPARIYIFTEKTGTPSEVVLSADPVVITWDDTAIDDVVHKAQAEVRLIATEDGMYRDIMQSTDPVYMQLYIERNGNMQRWWQGKYASSTITEPFSRDRNYEISLTFSDFNTLERVAYDGYLDNAMGVVSVSTIINRIISAFSATSMSLKIHPLPGASIGDTSFLDLKIRDAIFRESDGEPRNMLDILTDILEAANVHIMQYCGVIHLFCPDWFTAATSDEGVSESLEARSSDAEIEVCESFRRMELDYERRTGALYSWSPDMSDFVYSGQYADISDGQDGSEVLAVGDSSTIVAPGTFLAIAGGSISSSMILLMHDETSWPGGSKPTAPSSIGSIRYEIPDIKFCISKTQVASPSDAAHRIRISISFFAHLHHSSGDFGLLRADLPVIVKFTSMTGAVRYLKENASIFSPSRYSWQEAEGEVKAFLLNEQPDKSNRINMMLDIYIPDPGDTGAVSMHFDLTRMSLKDTDKALGESGIEISTPGVRCLGLTEIMAEEDGYFDVAILGLAERVHEDMTSTDDDVYSRTFSMGTPLFPSIGDNNNFIGYGSISKDSTFIRRYAGFVRRNMARSSEKPPRRRIHGTYSYNHLLGLPVFVPEKSLPLVTIAGVERSFYVKSEQWNIRTGLSDLTIEEADTGQYEPYPDSKYVIAMPASIRIDSAGTGQSVKIIASGATWRLAPYRGATASPLTGSEGTTEILVGMSENLTLKERTATIRIETSDGYNPGGIDTIDIVQAPASPYLELGSTSGLFPWGARTVRVAVDTNMDEIIAEDNSDYVSVSADGTEAVDIAISETPGGRDGLPITATVGVIGHADGYKSIRRDYRLMVGAAGFRADSIFTTAEVPPEGGMGSSYYVEFRSNASHLKISAVGSMLDNGTFWLFRRIGVTGSFQSYRKLQAGETDIYITDDPGAENMVYYQILTLDEYQPNTGSLPLAVAFVVTASAPGEEDKSFPLSIYQNQMT